MERLISCDPACDGVRPMGCNDDIEIPLIEQRQKVAGVVAHHLKLQPRMDLLDDGQNGGQKEGGVIVGSTDADEPFRLWSLNVGERCVVRCKDAVCIDQQSLAHVSDGY